jgi:hypothetical protein
MVGARLAREGSALVYQAHRVVNFTGKPRSNSSKWRLKDQTWPIDTKIPKN